MWACLLPNVAFYLAVRSMMVFERNGEGVQWTNILTPVVPGRRLSLGYIMLMLLVDTALYMLLTMYLENVLANEFGVRRPWYYPFLPSTWTDFGTPWLKYLNFRTKGNLLRTSHVAPSPSENEQELPPGFEPPPADLPVGIHLENLKKAYSKKRVAVDDVTLKMYSGEIFVLLGHNGAGKTTTISMLSGICAPTSGSAKINGYDIKKQLNKVRENLGLCPQYNMLFNDLTVQEHFIFFGKLKGLRGKETGAELHELLKSLQLLEKRNTLAKFLSGGQKRKLHLGIALLGKTGVAILDEPVFITN